MKEKDHPSEIIPEVKQEKVAILKKLDRYTVLTIVPIATLVMIGIILGMFTPNFLTIRNGINVLEQASVLALLAMGITPVLITGGIDLSLPSVLSLGAIFGAIFMRDGGNPVLAALIMVGSCMLMGAINGFSISSLKIIPFVQTLAMNFIVVGAATAITKSVSISDIPMEFVDAVQYRLFGFPVYSLITIVLAVFYSVLMRKSFFGRWLYAVGTNAKAARVSGIPTKKVIFGAYVFSSFSAGLAAVVSVGRLLSASAIMAGDTVTLDTIASAVVGGVSSFGGIGNPLGAALGALLITLISNSMNMMRVSYYLTLMIKGLVIIIFVWLNSRRAQ